MFIGDSIDDLLCGKRAGMVTVLLDETSSKKDIHPLADIIVQSLKELPLILHRGFHAPKKE